MAVANLASVQRTAGSLERDENYIPHLRSEYGLPPEKTARRIDYLEMFEETPIMTFGRLLIMQGLCVSMFVSLIVHILIRHTVEDGGYTCRMSRVAISHSCCIINGLAG